jgi:hypothetical protein
MRRVLVLVLVLALGATVPAEARRFQPNGAGNGFGGWRIPATLLALPLAVLQNVLAAATGTAANPEEALPGGKSISKRSGLCVVGFDLQERGKIAYVAVTGKVKFSRAQVLFDDGEMRDLDLRETTRSTGMYELLDFGRERGVIAVRLQARSNAARSEIGLRIGR